MYGIQQTKEAFQFVLQLFLSVRESVADDGRVTLRDTPNFLRLAWSAPTAFGGITEVPKEFSDLDEQEKQELRDLVRADFDIPNDQLELLIERTYTLMIEVVSLGTDWVQYARNKKTKA